jgi:hypothetical protein
VSDQYATRSLCRFSTYSDGVQQGRCLWLESSRQK